MDQLVQVLGGVEEVAVQRSHFGNPEWSSGATMQIAPAAPPGAPSNLKIAAGLALLAFGGMLWASSRTGGIKVKARKAPRRR